MQEPIISPVLQQWLGIFASIFLLAASLQYIIALAKGFIAPRPLSWIGWFLLMGTSMYSQVHEKGFEWSQITILISVIMCGVIFVISLFKGGVIERIDMMCVCLGIGCGIVYLITSDPWITTGFGITADLLVGFPTIQNAYRDPLSEKTSAWILGFIGFAITIVNCIGTDVLYWLFPVYLLLFNGTMACLVYFRKQSKP